MRTTIFFLLLISNELFAQSIFTAPASQTVGFPVAFTNVSGISDFSNNQSYWNYNSSGFGSTLTNPYNYGNPGNHLAVSTYSDYAFDGTNYYFFTSNYYTNDIVRWDFGNSLLNTPTTINLGNFSGQIPIKTEGIQIRKENNAWYGFVVGDNSTNKLIRMDFGASLSNPNPVIVQLGGVGKLAWPTELELFDDQGNWYGFVSNRANNSITRIDFGSSLTNTPVFTNLVSPFFNGPCNLRVIESKNNWYLFAANLLGNTLVRADLGPNVNNNAPTFTNLGNPGGLILPRAMMFIEDCNSIKGFICNENTGLLELSFAGDSVTGQLTTNMIGTMGTTFDACHDFSPFWENGILYFLQTNMNGTITRTQLTPTTMAGFSYYENVSTIPPFTYTSAGNQTMCAFINEGESGMRIQCHSINITSGTSPVDSLNAIFIHSPQLCDSLTVQFNDQSYHDNAIISWQWDFGDGSGSALQNPLHTYIVAGTYFVQLIISSALGNKDTLLQQIVVSNSSALPLIQINASQTVLNCNNSVVHLSASGAAFYTWSPASLFSNPSNTEQEISLSSSLPITLAGWNVAGCPSFDTIFIQYENSKNIFMPNAFSPNGDGVNDVFRIPSGFSFDLELFEIYNRYGERVFETDQLTHGWDGQFHNEPQNVNTYYWFIKGKSPCENIFMKGDVLLMR